MYNVHTYVRINYIYIYIHSLLTLPSNVQNLTIEQIFSIMISQVTIEKKTMVKFLLIPLSH